MASQVNHFKEFATVADYEAYIQPDDYAKPLVALVEATGTVMFPQGGGGGGGDCGNPILESVDVEDYSGMTFDGLAQITEVNFPAGISEISSHSLYGCKALTSVDLPSVLTIGESAFAGCTGLTSIDISSTVTTIGNHAFDGCSALTSADLSETRVTAVAQNLFNGCTHLASVDLPSTVTSIGRVAFANCSALTSVTCLATTPPTLANANAFQGTPANMVIYVPAESVQAYKTASGWSDYASQIQAIP